MGPFDPKQRDIAVICFVYKWLSMTCIRNMDGSVRAEVSRVSNRPLYPESLSPSSLDTTMTRVPSTPLDPSCRKVTPLTWYLSTPSLLSKPWDVSPLLQKISPSTVAGKTPYKMFPLTRTTRPSSTSLLPFWALPLPTTLVTCGLRDRCPVSSTRVYTFLGWLEPVDPLLRLLRFNRGPRSKPELLPLSCKRLFPCLNRHLKLYEYPTSWRMTFRHQFLRLNLRLLPSLDL